MPTVTIAPLALAENRGVNGTVGAADTAAGTRTSVTIASATALDAATTLRTAAHIGPTPRG
ncbi:hypothetical protein [Cellulomonas telluris]|uniref:hypothetical protein n=1 Tax=Cellulomonas telluris TaxID=2306636 RepID=UPI0010A9342C|nr:hypothetical protein [Cellulomonas telluris]